MEVSNITVLCRVVDNYGDIGVAHRLCNELFAITRSNNYGGIAPSITIIADNLSKYHDICPAVNSALPVQQAGGITVLDWNNGDACLRHYASPPDVILQCFQCGYPPWLEDMLFNRELTHDVYVVDIDYLTAEEWAGEFHLMPSLTRRCRVHKSLFMPGFTAKTGGLLLHGRTLDAFPPHYEDIPMGERLTLAAAGAKTEALSILVFAYPRDYTPLVDALFNMAGEFSSIGDIRGNEPVEVRTMCVRVMVAAGAGQASFVQAWQKAARTMPINAPSLEVLDMMSQTQWDKMLMSADAAFVRGEDSLAGAALAGVPFVWQAYPQECGAHIAKVKAFLQLIKPFFDSEQYSLIYRVWLMWNGDESTSKDTPEYTPKESASSSSSSSSSIELFLSKLSALRPGFARLASAISSNGDMAENLLAYLASL